MAKVVRWLSRALLVVFAQVALAALIGVLYQNISLTAPGCIRAHDNITSNLPMIIVGVTNPAGCSEVAIQSGSVTTPEFGSPYLLHDVRLPAHQRPQSRSNQPHDDQENAGQPAQ